MTKKTKTTSAYQLDCGEAVVVEGHCLGARSDWVVINACVDCGKLIVGKSRRENGSKRCTKCVREAMKQG